MIDTASHAVGRQQGVARARVVLLALGATGIGAISAFLWYEGRWEVALAGALALLAAGLLTWQPVLGFYLVCGAALAIDHEDPGNLGLISARVPFWSAFDTFSRVPLRLSPAEVIMLASFGWLLVRRAHGRHQPILRAGPLFAPCLAFIGVLVYGMWRGMNYQDLQLAYPFYLPAAVAEVRALAYIPLMYVLGHSLIDSPRRVRTLIWIVVTALGFKAIQATWVTVRLGAQVLQLNEIAPHEDSLFWSSLILLAVGLWLYRRGSRQEQVTLLLVPMVMIALVANQRRAGFIALAFGLVVISMMAMSDRRLRRQVLYASVVASVLVITYGFVFWKAEGLLAMPVYAFRSVYDPDERKVPSNVWRQIENLNIEHTIQRSPLLGLGFGQRYIMWIEEVSLDGLGFTYWRYITHNGIYWIWMKFGAVGLVIFWYLIGSALALGSLVFRRLLEGELKAVTLMIVGLIAMQMVFSYADTALTSGRDMAYLGAWMGVLASLYRLVPTAACSTSQEDERDW